MRWREDFIESTDGTIIRFTTLGRGRPILCCNGLGVPIYFWRHLAAEFAGDFQVICWDYRGHGKSSLPHNPYAVTYDDLIDDGAAIMAHLDLTEVIGVGHSAGFQILLALYERHPTRFCALASFLGTYGQVLSSFWNSPLSRLGFDVYYILAVYYPEAIKELVSTMATTPLGYCLGGLLGIFHFGEAAPQDIEIYLDHVAAMDPQFFATLTQGAEAHCAKAILPQIDIPTLLIAAEDDKFVPRQIADEMAATIPASELCILPGGSHAGLMECPAVLNQQLADFLARRVPGRGIRGRRRRVKP
jgi:pimeloyl-ACP methyl ester carboxylesterase